MKRPIHLVIDARCVRPWETGVGNSVYRHLLGLESLHPEGWRITVLRDVAAMADPGFSARWESMRLIHFIDTPADPTRHPAGDWWQQRALPRLLDRLGADIIYSPAYVGPIRTRRTRRVVMIHDDLVWTEPASYPAKFRAYMRIMSRLSARSAHRVLFPSEDARRLVSSRLGLTEPQTGVVPNAVDLRIFHPAPLDGRDTVVLCIASPERRKNHDVLVRAMNECGKLRIRFVGIPKEHPRLDELARLNPQRPWELIPSAPAREVADELRRAAVLAMPSRGEGFGMPLLEAMACGTPVIASDIPVLHEVAAGAALYCSPDDPAAWCAALRATIQCDENTRARREIGLQRAQQFCINTVGEKFLKELEIVLKRM